MIRVQSEAEMMLLGRLFAENLTFPAVFELVGDVGAGKTTFTRGLADGLGVEEAVTSPSFTISKRYAYRQNDLAGELIHYDFYRLDDAGLMRDELAEALALPGNVIVVEWGGGVADLLPESKVRLEISLNEDGSRIVEIISNTSEVAKAVENLWKTHDNLCKTCGKTITESGKLTAKDEEL